MEKIADMETFQKLAEQGDSNAQYEYGWALCCDNSVEKNWSLALYWFKKAAAQGHPKGLWKVGTCYEGVDDEHAVYWYEKSAEAGYPVAQWWLGIKYQRGEGVAQDYVQAIYWHKKAAETGDASSCLALGEIYEIGEGAEQDWQQSAYWYKCAANRYGDSLREARL